MFVRLLSGVLLSVMIAPIVLAQPILGEKLSHSLSEEVATGGSVQCTAVEPLPQDGWIRVFDPAQFGVTSDMEITSVSFGVSGVPGMDGADILTEQPIEIYIYEDTDPGGGILAADLEELVMETAMVPDDADETIYTHELEEPLLIEFGTVIAIEVRRPAYDDAITGRTFVVDANDGGQTAPSFISFGTGPCSVGFPEPTDIETVFLGIHVIITAEFVEGCVAPANLTCTQVDETTELSWENSGTYTEVEVFRDDESLAVLEAGETSYVDDSADTLATYRLVASYVEGDIDCSVDSAPCGIGVFTQCAEPDAMFGSAFADLESEIDFTSALSITDLDVAVDITHGWVGDVIISVASPEGTSVTLKEEDLDGTDRFVDISVTFDDDAGDFNAFLLPAGISMQPEGPGVLADFNLESALGDWTLTVDDNVDFDDGVLNSWCVSARTSDQRLFRRGDVDGNGSVSPLADSLALLLFQFAGGAIPTCLDAADVDGSDSVSALVDALFLLNFGFLLGDEPPAPGPYDCGIDDNLDAEVDCDESHASCL